MQKETCRNIDKDKGYVLLELARKTITEQLGMEYEGSTDLEAKLRNEEFDTQAGTFVTLKINGQLRGCIGNLRPDQAIRDGIRDNAINAALNDPRFPPLKRDELESIQVEISILTEPIKLEYTGENELLAKLVPGVDGVIIRKGIHSSTFLPQVWDQLPDKETFLGQLCLKAGLPMNEWKKGELLVYTYRVQDFEE